MSARCQKASDPLFQIPSGLTAFRTALLFGIAVVSIVGCSSSESFVPVSGKVTLNGNPLSHATVSFQPFAKAGSIEAGEGSTAKTNEKGEFTLSSSTGKRGALVGKHRVSISALDPQIGEHDARPPRGGWPRADKVPSRYNAKTELTYDVPSGGTNKADFDLTSP
jgi:hypothetical protein